MKKYSDISWSDKISQVGPTRYRKISFRKAVEEVLRIHPNFSLEYYANTLPYRNKEKLDTYIRALRKAGIPD
jgi:hypothetical protein